MDPLLDIGAAAVVAGYLVAFYKIAAPAAPSWALVLVSLLSGVGSALLIAVGEGATLTSQVAAQVVVQGVGAAAIAAGLTRTDSAGEGRREDASEPKYRFTNEGSYTFTDDGNYNSGGTPR